MTGPGAEESLAAALVSVWEQALRDDRSEVDVAGRRVMRTRTARQGLKVVAFAFGDHAIEGIEQNPEKPSRWGQLAREGQRIMQFRSRGRFFANVCEGKLMRYPAWKGLTLPE